MATRSSKERRELLAHGQNNTAIGVNALRGNTSGNNNIAIGADAAINQTTGNFNITIGMGVYGLAGEAQTIRLGAQGTQTTTYIAGIYNSTSSAGIPVYINSSGQLGTMTSSRRYKDDIADMGSASAALMKLRPVTFRYKSPFDDGSRLVQFGLIAEEVADVLPGLVARNPDGSVETVRYQFLAPMLLNEVQRQQHTIEAQAARITKLEQQLSELDALKRQTAELAKMMGAMAGN